MTQLYLDTEFNGHGGELISMALVSPEGEHWYGIRAAAIAGKDLRRRELDLWVEENVIPRLNVGDGDVMSDQRFRDSFHDFLTRFDNPEIVCDWNADGMLFCQWLAGTAYENSLDYPCRITILKTSPGQPISKNPHNALADAEALMLWHQEELTKGPHP